jgi:hypothetical protein
MPALVPANTVLFETRIVQIEKLPEKTGVQFAPESVERIRPLPSANKAGPLAARSEYLPENGRPELIFVQFIPPSFE